MHVIDLNEEHYPAQLTTTWDGELNGNVSLSAIIKPSKVNLQFIHNITEMWRIVDDDDTEYKIVYCKRRGTGNLLTVDVKALPKYQDDLNNQRIHRRIDQHLTANAFFHIVFNEPDELGNVSGYNFILNGTFEAQQWEGLGEGSTRLEMLKNGLNRYKAEFRISGNTIYIENQIGNDTSHRYEHRLNASNIVQEIDANEFWTYAKGYGDYGDGEGGEDWQNAKVIREYTSPLAQIPAIGIREAPPIKNGNYKADFMDSQLKILVDESLKISVSADIHDLRKQNYPIAQTNLGDRVFLIDRRIGFEEEVRVVAKSITKNWKGEIIALNLTFGELNITKRHQASMNTAMKNITALLEGKIKLPFSVLDNAVAEATKALHNMTSELSIPPNGGLMAVDKTNPNNLVLFNAAGLGVSTDGGATFENAITGQGINGKAIIAKSVVADAIAGGILVSLNGRTEWNMNTGDMYSHNTNWTFGTGAKINFLSTGNRIQFQSTDGGIIRSAGFGVGRALTGYPFAYSGTTGAADLDTLSEFYSGAMWQTTKAISEGAANSISGGRLELRNIAVGWTKGLIFDWFDTPYIRPMSHNTHDLGLWNFRFRRVYTDNIVGFPTVYFSNTTANRGFQADTDYIDGVNPTFRGQYPAENHYNLGADWAPFSYTYTNTIYRNYEHELSSHGSKMNIEDVDMELAELYVDRTDVKNFYYKNQYNENDYVNPYSLRTGVVIEQLEESMEHLIKGDANSIDSTSIPFVLQAVLRKTRQDFNAYKLDTNLLIEMLFDEIEQLKGESANGAA